VAERRSTSRSVWRPLHRLQARLDAAVAVVREAPELAERRRGLQVLQLLRTRKSSRCCAGREPASLRVKLAQ